MKLLLSLLVAGSATLFAGGDILPVPVKTKFEPVVQKQRGCYKPNIKKCPDCVEVAEICPDNPNVPTIESEVCEGLVGQGNH